ncbi:50S ribosomal protein L18 [SAR202 cluster bacterium AD-493-K16_JPT_193m]|nr:50S ribosomal protein L18 [SAR202 cluster bacterium AD-493-K16_JPT_193m]
MGRYSTRSSGRKLRHIRVRKKVVGTAERPRLTVFRSSRQVYAQLIDDSLGHTMASASSLPLKEDYKEATKTNTAAVVGKNIAEAAVKLGVSRIVFDRGGYKYHGRIKALAEAVREGGLVF